MKEDAVMVNEKSAVNEKPAKKAEKVATPGRMVSVMLPGKEKSYPGILVEVLSEKERCVIAVFTPEGEVIAEADHQKELPKVATDTVWAWPKHS